MPKADLGQPKVRTAAAVARLCLAQSLVAWVPFHRWRDRLGLATHHEPQFIDLAKRLAADVDWAAKRLPFRTKCLPRAMALSWLLRGRGLGHTVVIAIRPRQLRRTPDALHAWVEVGDEKILGELPGPWIEILRLGAGGQHLAQSA